MSSASAIRAGNPRGPPRAITESTIYGARGRAAVAPYPAGSGGPRRTRRRQLQGSVYSLVVESARIASRTPSLTPCPESPTPPNGVSSVR